MTQILQKERVKKSLSIATPAALNSLLDMVNIMVDLIMVGVISSYATVAVGVGLNFMMIIFSIIAIFFVGTNAIISRLYGAKEMENAGSALFSIAVFASICALPLVVVGLTIAESFYGFIGVSPQAQEVGVEYLSVMVLPLPFLFLKMVFTSALSACGETKYPFFVKSLGSLINVFLNYCLIYGNLGFPELGVLGAGIATAVVHVIEFSILLLILKSGISAVRIESRFDFTYVKKALKVGIPTGFDRFFTFLSFILFSKFIATYGTFALAGYQIGIRAEGLAFMPGVGFMIASMALMGQNLGAKNEHEAERSVYTTLLLATVIMGSVGLFFIFAPELIAHFFSKDMETIEEASKYLLIIGFSQIPLAIFFVLDGALRGAGATKITLVVNSLSIWILRVIPAYALSSFHAPLYLIFFVITAETYIRAIIYWIVFKRGVWRGINI